MFNGSTIYYEKGEIPGGTMPINNSSESSLNEFCNVIICGLPAFIVGVVGILCFLLSAIIWCCMCCKRSKTKRYSLSAQRRTLRKDTDDTKCYMETYQNDVEMYDEAFQYQNEVKRRYQKDPTQGESDSSLMQNEDILNAVDLKHISKFRKRVSAKSETESVYAYADPTTLTHVGRHMTQEKHVSAKSETECFYAYADPKTLTHVRRHMTQEPSTGSDNSDYDYVEQKRFEFKSSLNKLLMNSTESLYVNKECTKVRTTTNVCDKNLKRACGRSSFTSTDQILNKEQNDELQVYLNPVASNTNHESYRSNEHLHPQLIKEINNTFSNIDCVSTGFLDTDNVPLSGDNIIPSKSSGSLNDDYMNMENRQEFATSSNCLNELENPGCVNFTAVRESSDSSSSDETYINVTNGVSLYKPRGVVHVTVKKMIYLPTKK